MTEQDDDNRTKGDYDRAGRMVRNQGDENRAGRLLGSLINSLHLLTNELTDVNMLRTGVLFYHHYLSLLYSYILHSRED